MNAKAIQLEEKKMIPVVDLLNDLLANYHLHYQNLRGCHWNVRGPQFFTLHAKFEELYNQALVTIDELAERILTLGKSPFSTFSEYLENSQIEELSTIGMKDNKMVAAIIQDLETLIGLQRDLLAITSEAHDEGTNDMINAAMQFNEKQNWMLRAFTNG